MTHAVPFPGADHRSVRARYETELEIAAHAETRDRDGINVLERELMRPRLLEVFGWRITHVLAKDWYDNPQTELERVLALLDAAAPAAPSSPADI